MQLQQQSFQYEVYDDAAELAPADAALLQKARETTQQAYAPYSHFRVGAAALLEHESEARERGGTGRDAAALRESVTSRGGTTEAAIHVLQERGVAAAFIDAVQAGRDRGRAIGGGDDCSTTIKR